MQCLILVRLQFSAVTVMPNLDLYSSDSDSSVWTGLSLKGLGAARNFHQLHVFLFRKPERSLTSLKSTKTWFWAQWRDSAMTHQDGMWNRAGEKTSDGVPVWVSCCLQVPFFFLNPSMNMGSDGGVGSLRLLDSNLI